MVCHKVQFCSPFCSLFVHARWPSFTVPGQHTRLKILLPLILDVNKRLIIKEKNICYSITGIGRFQKLLNHKKNNNSDLCIHYVLNMQSSSAVRARATAIMLSNYAIAAWKMFSYLFGFIFYDLTNTTISGTNRCYVSMLLTQKQPAHSLRYLCRLLLAFPESTWRTYCNQAFLLWRPAESGSPCLRR